MTILHLFDHPTCETSVFRYIEYPRRLVHLAKRQNHEKASHLTQTKTLENSYGPR